MFWPHIDSTATVSDTSKIPQHDVGTSGGFHIESWVVLGAGVFFALVFKSVQKGTSLHTSRSRYDRPFTRWAFVCGWAGLWEGQAESHQVGFGYQVGSSRSRVVAIR